MQEGLHSLTAAWSRGVTACPECSVRALENRSQRPLADGQRDWLRGVAAGWGAGLLPHTYTHLYSSWDRNSSYRRGAPWLYFLWAFTCFFPASC